MDDCSESVLVKPAAFGYVAPATLEEALAVLSDHGDDAKVIAGGQSLVPMLAMRLVRTPLLIDLRRIEALRGIDASDRTVELGAMVRHVEIERSNVIRAALPLLADAVGHIGHAAIRSRGTIGGSLCHADPAAELPAVALTLDAEVTATSIRGERSIPATELFDGLWTTTLAPDEILTSVSIERWGAGSGFGFREFSRRHGDFALAGAAVGVAIDDTGLVTRAAIALLGVASTPVRVTSVEALIAGASAADLDGEAIQSAVAASLDPPTDLHATGSYRRRVAGYLTRLALDDAVVAATQQSSAA